MDAYNVRVGTQTFAGMYNFTTNTLLLETAQAIQGMGSDIIKLYLGSSYQRQYSYTLGPNITNLVTLVRDDPSCRRTFDMPFRHIIAWAYPFKNQDAPFQDGNYTAAEQADDYREMYDLTQYLLTNYNNSGKTFYLGHWEGDGYLSVNNWSTNPSPAVVQAMVLWENTRQKAVDDAKAATLATNVSVYYYAEANRTRDAMLNGPTNNVRMINAVVPYVTNLDYLSYSSYDVENLSSSDLYATLDYMEAHLPTNKVSNIPGERIWIGEYGWGTLSPTQLEANTRAYLQRLLNYTSKALPYMLFWEIYDNETNRTYCLIDSNDVKTASYYLHQNYINDARLLTAQFKETNGRLPSNSEFVGLVSPMLNQPLPTPVRLAVSDAGAALLTATSAQVSGTLAQGVYGDEQASVWVYWGLQDGGTSRTAWANGQFLGVNTNFNPASFSAVLTNLASQTNYYYRFYAINTGGAIWAPASDQFSTVTLNPPDYGTRMKITFAGYNRGEALSNFPVLVKLGTNLPGFSYTQFASPTGGDLRFTDSGGTALLPFEIDEWHTNGTSSVWVNVPNLGGPNDFIWAYWGNPLATALPLTSTNGSVWRPNFFAVYHLREAGFPYADSTQQHPALTGVAPGAVPGEIGQGCGFNGSSDYLDCGSINLGDAFTLSAWVNIPSSASNIQTLWANKQGGWNSAGLAFFVDSYNTADQEMRLETGDGTTGLAANTASNTVSFGQWHLLSAAINRTNGTVEFYVDGNDLGGSTQVATDFVNLADMNLGRFTNGSLYFTGVMDEARIQNGAASANWSWASWATVAANSTLANYAPVSRSAPSLALSTGPGSLVLSWPANGVGFSLYSTTNLAPPVAWTPVTTAPTLTGNQWQVTLPANNAPTRFFRLQTQ